MLEQFLPGLSPKSPMQSDLQYGFKLYGINQIGESILSRLFKTKKQELEERVLERQLELMGENPDTQSLNRALLGVRVAQEVPTFISQLTSVPVKKKPFTLADALKSTEHNVDFRIPMQQHRAAYLKRMAKGIAKAI